MYREDYILRHIRLFVQVIAKILGLIKDGDLDFALTLIENSFIEHLGLSLDDFIAYPNERLVEFLTFGELGSLGINKAGLAANLLLQAGKAYEGKGQPEKALRCREKGLALLVELHLADPPVQEMPEFAPTVSDYLAGQDWEDLSDDLLGSLVFFFESEGGYQDAEQAVDALLARAGDDPETVEFVVSYYEYLLEEDEAILMTGGLSPDAVRSRLAGLRS